MILLIDNYDSFTYNLVQRIGEIDPTVDLQVVRNDKIAIEEIAALAPSHIVISPGPCTPTEAGVSVEVVKAFQGKIPILGVCLGHQSIGEANGARIVRAKRLMHGKVDDIFHDGKGFFADLPNPFVATRYHSLVIEPSTLPEDFELSAWTFDPHGDKEIMAVRHKTAPVEGWQFHPESFLTQPGVELLRRFLALPQATGAAHAFG